MIALTTVPVLVLTWIAVDNTRRSVETQIVDANLTRVRWAAQYLEEVLERFDDLFYSLQIDDDFIRVLEASEESDGPGSEEIQREIVRLLTASYYSYSAIVDRLILYIHATGRATELDNVTRGGISRPDLSDDLWAGATERPIPLSLRRRDGAIYAMHTLNRFMDQSFQGAMLARVDGSFQETVKRILASDGDSTVYLLNESHQVLVASPSPHIPPSVLERVRAKESRETGPVVDRTETDLLFYHSIRRGRLAVVKTVPLAIVSGSAAGTVAAGLLTGGVLLALSVILSVFFSLRISRPIVQLAESMRQASIPAFSNLRGQNRDEIRELQEGYETLIAKVKTLVQKEYVQEMELKDARLLALQAQINPHFLNNTLNLLGGMAVARGVPEIYRIARAVGDMFRYAAEVERDLVTLSQELAHARNYLLIQEHRFQGRCTVTVGVAPEVQATRIPRFTLQPLVENAFEHGLQGKRGNWTVSIHGRRQRRGTIVVVEDNGQGMSAEGLRALRSRLRAPGTGPDPTHSIGLRNVNARLMLHFGERYGLRVFSSRSRGTRVVVVIPNRGIEGLTAAPPSDGYSEV